MEKKIGVFFNEADIKAIVEKHLDWAEVVPGQVFCGENIMSDSTPIGTSIIVGVDGIKCDDDSDTVRLVFSAGIYEIPVKTVHDNEELNIRFDETVPVPGTYGKLEDGILDILTDEEKEFKHFVDTSLGEREDEYAMAIRKDNVRNIGGRSLILLEKVKDEIKNDDLLFTTGITPMSLMGVFIEKTASYIEACKNIDDLTHKHDEVYAEYKATYDENSKGTRKLAREIETLNRKIDANRHTASFCLATIETAVLPVLNRVVER